PTYCTPMPPQSKTPHAAGPPPRRAGAPPAAPRPARTRAGPRRARARPPPPRPPPPPPPRPRSPPPAAARHGAAPAPPAPPLHASRELREPLELRARELPSGGEREHLALRGLLELALQAIRQLEQRDRVVHARLLGEPAALELDLLLGGVPRDQRLQDGPGRG